MKVYVVVLYLAAVLGYGPRVARTVKILFTFICNNKTPGELAEALAADPKSARALVLQAQIKVADGQVDEALKILESTLASQLRSIDALEQKVQPRIGERRRR